MRWLARIWPSNAVRRRAGECPAPLQIGECANRFRDGRRSTRAAVLQQSQPIVVETRAVMHALLLGRASERAKSWLARAHRKSIPPRKLERQEGGFSVGAVFIRSLEYRFYTRFAVTNQLKNAAGSEALAAEKHSWRGRIVSSTLAGSTKRGPSLGRLSTHWWWSQARPPQVGIVAISSARSSMRILE